MTRTATQPAAALTASDLVLATTTQRARQGRKGPRWSPTVHKGGQVPGEGRDCIVRGLMTVTGSTYKAAHALIAARTGRRFGKGTPWLAFSRMLDNDDTVLGCKFERVVGGSGEYVGSGRRMTLAKFIKRHPVGVYFVWKRGHGFAIVDGVLVDTWLVGNRAQVAAAWRVTLAAPTTTHHASQLRALLIAGWSVFDAADACGVDRADAMQTATRLGALGALR